MSDIEAGDLVVCIDGDFKAPDHVGWMPKEGRAYRAYRVGHAGGGKLAIGFREDPMVAVWGWAIEHFRKIDPATDEFTAQMRAIRPAMVPA